MPREEIKNPNQHYLAVATYICLLPLVYFVPPMVGKYVENRFYAVAISLALIVPFMTYVLTPFVKKALLWASTL